MPHKKKHQFCRGLGSKRQHTTPSPKTGLSPIKAKLTNMGIPSRAQRTKSYDFKRYSIFRLEIRNGPLCPMGPTRFLFQNLSSGLMWHIRLDLNFEAFGELILQFSWIKSFSFFLRRVLGRRGRCKSKGTISCML